MMEPWSLRIDSDGDEGCQPDLLEHVRVVPIRSSLSTLRLYRRNVLAVDAVDAADAVVIGAAQSSQAYVGCNSTTFSLSENHSMGPLRSGRSPPAAWIKAG